MHWEELEKTWHTPSEPIEMDKTDFSVEAFMEKLTLFVMESIIRKCGDAFNWTEHSVMMP